MSTSKRHQRLLRKFQCSYSLLPSHGGEMLQEDLERVAGLEVVDQVFQRHPCSGEYDCSTLNVRIRRDHFVDAHKEIVPSLAMAAIADHGRQRRASQPRVARSWRTRATPAVTSTPAAFTSGVGSRENVASRPKTSTLRSAWW